MITFSTITTVNDIFEIRMKDHEKVTGKLSKGKGNGLVKILLTNIMPKFTAVYGLK